MAKKGFIHMMVAILSILCSHCSVIRESGFNFENELLMKELQALQDERTVFESKKILSNDDSASSESLPYGDEDNLIYKRINEALDDIKNNQTEDLGKHVIGLRVDLGTGEVEELGKDELKEKLERIRANHESDELGFYDYNSLNEELEEYTEATLVSYNTSDDISERKIIEDAFDKDGSFNIPTISHTFGGMSEEDLRKLANRYTLPNEFSIPSEIPLEPVEYGSWHRQARIPIIVFVIVFVIGVGLKCYQSAHPRQRIVLVATVFKKREEESDKSYLIPAKQPV